MPLARTARVAFTKSSLVPYGYSSTISVSLLIYSVLLPEPLRMALIPFPQASDA